MGSQKAILKYIKLILGYFFCALGIVVIIRANIGVAPWDVFHMGLSKTIHVTLGQASMMAGATVIALNVILGQPIGIGTILNMLLIGLFTDMIYYSDIIPIAGHLWLKIPMLFIGMVIFSYGTFLYIVQSKGCGPRDGLMQILNKKTNISVGIVKNSIELIALLIGWRLGGPVGIGTVVYALTIGFIVQFFFSISKIELKTLKHDTLKDEWISLKHHFQK